MLNPLPVTKPCLNRAAWHRPLVSVIVTHHNYSSFVGDALASLLDQTHSNWECAVIDDGSSPEHRVRLEEIVHSISDTRISLHCSRDNAGQVLAFFKGLEHTSGEFVCLLDPDDRYAETFLEEMLAVHLNETVFCPVASSDQYLLGQQGLISAVNTRQRMRGLERVGSAYRIKNEPPSILYIPRSTPGWQWASTSSLMFRRAVLKYLMPHRPLARRDYADAYLAIGAHALGGTLFLPKPLVYRSVHNGNASLTTDIYATDQIRNRDGESPTMRLIRRDLAEVLAHNGAPHTSIPPGDLGRRPRSMVAKWKRSVLKRMQWARA